MKKILLVLLASTALVISSVRCTSSDSGGETGEQIASEGGENPEGVDGSVGDATGGEVAGAETLSEGGLTDPAVDPSLDPNANPETASVVDPSQQVDANGMPIDPNAQALTPPPETQPTTPTTGPDTLAATTTPTETVPPTSVTEAPPTAVPEAKPVVAEYQKMKDSTWTVSKKVVNTVYFARPGDTVKSIAEKIYGNADRVKELKKINSVLKGREARVGDKIYYNSPNRPDDATKIITYYEDKGLQPQVYTAKEGDKVKNVSKELLGFDNAWKEVWGSNAFDSKKSLEPGTEIKYWKEDGAGTVMAKTDPPPPPPADPPPMDPGLPPPPPPGGDVGMNPPPPPDMPPPPPPMDPNMPPPPPPGGDVGMTPPPPPDMPPPPPPDPGPAPTPDPSVGKTDPTPGDETTIAGMDQEMIMIVGIGAAALLLVVIVIVKRKNKQRQEFEQAMNETQVG